MTLEVLQSSAYKATKVVGETTSGRSFIKITKNKGPKRDPWDTPEGIGCQSELFPSITTLCSQFGKYSLHQFKRQPETLKLHNFCIKITWDTLSKALLKSKRTAST